MGDQALMTTAEVAAALGVSRPRVRQLADAGALAVIGTPLGRLYDPQSVAALMRRRSGATIGDNSTIAAVNG